MMIIAGQSNRVWHYWCGVAHGKGLPSPVGVLIGPSYGKKVPVDKWMPFVLDNDAFTAWRDKKPWSETAWMDMLRWIRMTGIEPLWAAVPDVVANRDATLSNWPKYSPVIKDMGWKTAFCVQDGMTPDDVPEDADLVFVGGSDGWKFPNLPMWTQNFPRVHCARVTSQEMIEACDRLGCESVDGTGWFRAPSRPDHLPMLERFIKGQLEKHPEFAFV